MSSAVERFGEKLWIITVAIILATLLKIFIIDVVWIPTRSMESTILPGDYVIVSKIFFRPTGSLFTDASIPIINIPILKINRGDVLLFEFPQYNFNSDLESKKLIKRCVGLPGDTVQIRNGHLFVNDIKGLKIVYNENINYGPIVVPKVGMTIKISKNNLSEWESLIKLEGHSISTNGDKILIDNEETYTFRKNYLFMLGDNLNESFDSRGWGFLPEENVLGKAVIIYWSADISTPVQNLSDFFSHIRWSRIGTLINNS